MWSSILDMFEAGSAERRVARLLIERGFTVTEDEGVVSHGVAVPHRSIANALDLEERRVDRTVETILEDDHLAGLFANLTSKTFFEDAVSVLDISVVTVQVADAAESGILADITAVFDEHGVMIRQMVVEDPVLNDAPQFVAIVDGQVPPELMLELNNLTCTEACFYAAG
jgi:predicted regulator of amino acid metabolism with ACT domain